MEKFLKVNIYNVLCYEGFCTYMSWKESDIRKH
jgi:hypothetical protein